MKKLGNKHTALISGHRPSAASAAPGPSSSMAPRVGETQPTPHKTSSPPSPHTLICCQRFRALLSPASQFVVYFPKCLGENEFSQSGVSILTKFLILPTSQPDLPRVFLFSVKVNPILPGAQVGNLGMTFAASLDLVLISNPSAHLQSVYKA